MYDYFCSPGAQSQPIFSFFRYSTRSSQEHPQILLSQARLLIKMTNIYKILIISKELIMKVFALVSGGKDSIFNIHKCIQHGHQVVALGNLYNIDEILECQAIQSDSYMYQTVGSNMTLGIAQALGLPIFRKPIKGKPKITNLQYQGTINQKQGDEVEDLYQLLVEAKKAHPQINAVSSGAIFSTYQKLRVQNICARLGMTSLAYLWQRDQAQLLKQMIQYPLNAIIIKVASYGLKVSHLGKSISELLPTFMKLQGQCGMNVCGEGGQFQSLVLDCPLFKKRIIIDEIQTIQVQKNQIAPVAYLKINKFHLEQK